MGSLSNAETINTTRTTLSAFPMALLGIKGHSHAFAFVFRDSHRSASLSRFGRGWNAES